MHASSYAWTSDIVELPRIPVEDWVSPGTVGN
ncbi:hypothetical protein P3T21_003810 [Paraburkholderia sp. GAS334]